MTATMSRRPAGAPTGSHRLFSVSTSDLQAHADGHGPVPWQARGRLIATLRAAGLTGRGGAGFPTWRKLATVAEAGRRAVVIANAVEGEPASTKDRALLGYAPHLVLDGLQLAAEAVGAGSAYLYAPADLVSRVGGLLARRRSGGWDRVAVTTVAAPPSFVAGEESAVVSAVEGGPARPRDTPELVARSGVRGAPTLVQNVETLAHLALIARYGPEWFRSQGTADEPGTFLATIGGAVARPGVYEAPLGVGLGALLATAGGPSAPLQAVLLGGYHGGWVPADPQLPVARADLAPYQASPGAGVVLALAATSCGLVESAGIVDYLARQSAGQCGPCLNGLPRLADTLGRLARGERHPGLPSEVERLARLVHGRGACKHPDGTARFIASTMVAFDGEVDLHLAGRCRGHR